MFKSLLIVINEEYLSKGIALALLNHFKSIHISKNPYEAIDICKNEKIDMVISNVNFDTIEPEEYVSEILLSTAKTKCVILIKDAPLTIKENNSTTKILIKEKPVSIKELIETINLVNQQTST